MGVLPEGRCEIPAREQLTFGSLFAGIPSEGSTLDLNAQECDASGRSKLTPTVSECLPSTGPTSGDGTTCEPSRQQTESGASMLSAEGSRARTLAPRIHKDAGSLATEAACGGNITGSSKRRAPSGSSSKTRPPFAVEDWTRFSGHLLRSGVMRNGIVYPLEPLVRVTEGTESGSFPTLTKAAAIQGPSQPDGKRGETLISAVRRARQIFATLTARDWRSGKASQATHDRNSRPLSEQIGGTLNPTWCEWFMGFPTEWTELHHWEMPLFHKSPNGSDAES